MAAPEIVVSLRGVLALVLLLAALVGLLAWLGKEPPASHVEPPQRPLLATFAGDALRTVDVACAPGTWTLRRSVGGWRIVQPFDAEANARKVADLIAALQDARAAKTVAAAGADAAAFGLAPPLCRAELAIADEPSPRVVRLGRTSPVGIERYAIAADGSVVLTEGSLFGLLARDASALRERRLLPVEPEAVTSIAIEGRAGRLALAKEAGDWRVVAPLRDAASSAACSALARAIAAIELDTAGGASAPIASRPDRRIRIEVSVGSEGPPRVAFVAAAGIEGKRLGWREDGALVGVFPESEAAELTQEVETFRDKRVTVLSAPDVRWVTIERNGSTLRVERSELGRAWTGRDSATPFVPDARVVEELLSRLRTLTAVGFEPERQDRKATGTIAVGGAMGELARLTWGQLPPTPGQEGEFVWVTTPSRPGVVFRVPATDLGPIPASAAAWTGSAAGAKGAGS